MRNETWRYEGKATQAVQLCIPDLRSAEPLTRDMTLRNGDRGLSSLGRVSEEGRILKGGFGVQGCQCGGEMPSL